MNALSRLLEDRSPRERATFALLVAAVVAALLVAFAWLPLERARTRLVSQLPALRASIATLEREAEEAGRLRAMPAVAKGSGEALAAIPGARPLAGAQVSVIDANTLAVNGPDIAFGALIEWIAAVQATHGLRVQSARIEALPTQGRVRAELRLTRT